MPVQNKKGDMNTTNETNYGGPQESLKVAITRA